MMALQQFVVLVDKAPTEYQFVGLFAKCGDVVVEENPGRRTSEIKFDRDAPTLADAIVSGLRDLESLGITAIRVREDDDLVTLPVVAQRVARSREAVRLWSVGHAGVGGYPAAVDAALNTHFYRWSQVGPWMVENLGVAAWHPEPVLSAVNLTLRLRTLAPRVERWEVIRSLLTA
jgi:hypothetical protein